MLMSLSCRRCGSIRHWHRLICFLMGFGRGHQRQAVPQAAVKIGFFNADSEINMNQNSGEKNLSAMVHDFHQ